MATVERLQMLWALLALFGTMSWLALAPSLTFRNKNDAEHFKSSVYNFFLFATVCTSLSAIWQSLCPFLIRQSQQALFPRVINHPATQTATIVISIVLTLLNFFSWMVLASDKEAGAKTSCTDGTYRLSDKPGYVAQCRGVNVAIVFDVVVFLLWLPISLVIVCGTVERGLWWWGDDDGWAQGELVGGSNMMSEEEFDLKIGMGSGKQIKRRQTVHPDNLEQQQEREMVQRPKPAFVTPIASQFRSQSADDEDDDINFTPSSYRRHRQQRQQRQTQVQVQEPKRLTRRGSNTSLSSRLSSFFGQGWASGMMPPEDEPPMPQLPSQYRNNNNLSVPTTPTGATPGGGNKKKVQMAPPPPSHRKEEREAEPEPAGLMHGDSYSSQWHSRWS
ncbi:hypothetical protein BGX31_011266 [Mortierella sp. GBA43]|nr:hypothetical protein BGX31_011266 [Mortierella sp. GBA43]